MQNNSHNLLPKLCIKQLSHVMCLAPKWQTTMMDIQHPENTSYEYIHTNLCCHVYFSFNEKNFAKKYRSEVTKDKLYIPS